jgi:hypothetical protein
VEGLSGSGPADWQVVQPSSSIKVRVGTEKASQGEAGRSVCPGSPLPRLRAKAEASPGGQPAPPACCRALSSGHKLPACDACTALAVPQVDPGYLSEPVAVEFATEGGLTAFMNYYAPRNKVRPCCVSLLLPCVLRLWQRSMRMAFGDGSCRPSAPCPRASALPLTPSPRNNTTQQQRKHKKQHPPPPAGLRPAAGQPAAAAGEDPRGPHLSGQHRLLPGPAVLDQPGLCRGGRQLRGFHGVWPRIPQAAGGPVGHRGCRRLLQRCTPPGGAGGMLVCSPWGLWVWVWVR